MTHCRNDFKFVIRYKVNIKQIKISETYIKTLKDTIIYVPDGWIIIAEFLFAFELFY